jgi:hypothetical protein
VDGVNIFQRVAKPGTKSEELDSTITTLTAEYPGNSFYTSSRSMEEHRNSIGVENIKGFPLNSAMKETSNERGQAAEQTRFGTNAGKV